jgi:hypothetical protein
MLASITPLGERGRQSRWWLTVTAFLIGATLAGAAFGALLGAAGSAVFSGVGGQLRLAVLAFAAIVAVALDASPLRVPGPRRQVEERWRDEYRGWVYGAGYGAQLGLGITTVVASAATYLALVAAVLCASASAGALIVGLFGAVRGLQPLAAARVRRPEQLIALHARLRRLRPAVRPAGSGLLIAVVALAIAGASA